MSLITKITKSHLKNSLKMHFVYLHIQLVLESVGEYSWYPGYDQIQCEIRENANFLRYTGFDKKLGSGFRQIFGTRRGNVEREGFSG